MRIVVDEVESQIINDYIEELLFRAYLTIIKKKVKHVIFSTEEKLRSFIQNEVLVDIDEEAVSEQWKSYIFQTSVLQNISQLYFLKYECLDYRNTALKTDHWIQRLSDAIVQGINNVNQARE